MILSGDLFASNYFSSSEFFRHNIIILTCYYYFKDTYVKFVFKSQKYNIF